MTIPTLAEWKAATGLGVLSRRSNELLAIDDRIAAYHRAVSLYGRSWEAREIRIALDAWKAKRPAGQQWWKDERNQKLNGGVGPFEALDDDRELPDSAAARTQDAELGERLRWVTLQFFGKCTTEAVPTDAKELLTTYVDSAAATHDLVNVGAATRVEVKPRPVSIETPADNFLEKINQGAVDLVKGIAARSGGSGYASTAASFVIARIPEIVGIVLGSVLKQLKAVAEIAKNIKTAVSAAIAAWQTRELEDGILSGHPRLIVQSVREQIKDKGKKAVKDAVKTALIAGIGIANPIAGTVVHAIASLFSFLSELYQRIEEQLHLRRFFEEARVQTAKALYKEPREFQDWFAEEIKDLPIISSVCMANPLLGGYCGFLTLVATDGTELSYRQLERNYAQFNDVKQAARDFVKDYKVKIYGVDKLTQHYLDLTRTGGVVDDIKEGFMGRLKSLGFGMAKEAVS